MIFVAKKLNFRFHDPNPSEVTAEAVFQVFMEVNAAKVERAIRAAAQEEQAKNKTGDKPEE